ncbi:MAG: sodium:proton antiporter [Candidatus Caenarcaniphilales bacterium]|nr:sodium:proton antiporter [Candidatus Caenarcaniphilales bacterium]
MDTHALLHAIGWTLFAAGIAQYVAWKLNVPSIIFLIIAGVILGPISGVIDVDQVFGHALNVIIELTVVILLFEGGLNLKFHELKGSSFGVKRLISLGVVVNAVICSFCAHKIGGLSWEISWIIASILVVTGPTAIIPVLRQINVDPKIKKYLKWEAIINDPIGVLMTMISYQYLVYAEGGSSYTIILWSIFKAVGFSILVTAIIGSFIKYVFDKTQYPDFLKIPTVLSVILLIFIVSREVQEGSGLLAVTFLGIYFTNNEMLVFSELRKFKESISVFTVSILFILLSANIDFKIIHALNFRHFLFIAAVVLVVRVIAIFISTIKSDMSWRESLLVGWFGPRGIVAASIAGIIGLRLEEVGFDEAKYILPIVFLVVFATVIIHGISFKYVAKLLGIQIKDGKGLVIVGSSRWATEFAKTLGDLGVKVLIVDSNWYKLKRPRQQGIKVHYGEIVLDIETGQLDLSDYGYLFTATDNNAYNAYVCGSLGEDFGKNNIFQLPLMETEKSRIETLSKSFGGQLLADKDLFYENIKQRIFYGWGFKATQLSKKFKFEDFQKIGEKFGATHLLTVHKDKSLDFITDLKTAKPKPDDIIISFTNRALDNIYGKEKLSAKRNLVKLKPVE